MTKPLSLKKLMIMAAMAWLLASTPSAVSALYDPFYFVNSDHLSEGTLVNHMEIDLSRL